MKPSLNQIVQPLTEWFEQNRRDLPWRKDRDPYHVWISEIMLQQTRIEAVMCYYERFMSSLPDVRSLSEIDDDSLYKLWEGLGYYSRAKNLKKAAEKIMSQYGGVFPRSYKELLTLPGIGEYTAGAIASICYDEKIPAVDGNVLRVIARVTKDRDDVLLPQTKRRVFSLLFEIMPERAGVFNEALMELGETVCLPNGAPLCDRCPVREFCAACKENLTSKIPVRVKKTKRKKENITVFLITSPDRRLAIEKRPEKGLLSGLYQLPNVPGFFTDGDLPALLAEWELSADRITFLKEEKHVFTHIDWMIKAYRVKVPKKNSRFLWVTEDELSESYPLPTAFLKLL